MQATTTRYASLHANVADGGAPSFLERVERGERLSEPICRVCYLIGDANTLIKPCACGGLDQYVHRACLEQVRVNSSRPQSIYNCEKCGSDYRLVPRAGETTDQRRRRAKFHALVLRDFFVVFCFVQFAIVSLGLLVRSIDEACAYCIPECQTSTNTSIDECTACPPIKTILFPESMEDHDRITYYICGIVSFLSLVGLFGLCNSCCRMIEHPAPVIRIHQHRHPRACFCLSDCCDDDCCTICCRGYSQPCRCDCDCGEGCCKSRSGGHCKCEQKGDKDDCAVLVVVVAIVVIMFAVIGVFYGIVLSTALFQRIVQRHMHTLELRLLATDYPVADLAEPLDQNVPYAQIVADVREMV